MLLYHVLHLRGAIAMPGCNRKRHTGSTDLRLPALLHPDVPPEPRKTTINTDLLITKPIDKPDG